MYKQNPKSPILKALVGNQHKLPQHLQDAIKAAPESPAKQVKDKEAYRKERQAKASAYMDSLKEKRATMAEKHGDKGRAQRIRSTKDHQE